MTMLTAIIVTAAAIFAVLALVARSARARAERVDRNWYTETWVCTACGAEFSDEWDASLHVEVAHRDR
ncbi:MAG: hypothetical protein QM753_06865 [Thermomicrobiales bacterium]